jgi:anti-repressor protein
MAKEVAMVENNDKGKQARRYFIDVEKKAVALHSALASYAIEDPIERAKAWIVEQEAKRALEYKIAEQAPMVEFAETVIASENSEKIGDYAKSLSKMHCVTVSPNKLFQWLRENKYLMIGRDASERNKPYQKHIENGLFEIKYQATVKGRVLVPYITGKGQFELSKIIVEYFNK